MAFTLIVESSKTPQEISTLFGEYHLKTTEKSGGLKIKKKKKKNVKTIIA